MERWQNNGRAKTFLLDVGLLGTFNVGDVIHPKSSSYSQEESQRKLESVVDWLAKRYTNICNSVLLKDTK